MREAPMKLFIQKNFLPYAIWLLMCGILLGACGQLPSEPPHFLPPSPSENDFALTDMEPMAVSSSNPSFETAQKAVQQDKKVSLCHKTGSQGNPYVFMTVSQKGDMNGHSNHAGDIFNVSSPDDCAQSSDPTGPTGPTVPTVTTPTATTPPPATPNPTETPTPTPQYKPTNICHATGDPAHPYEFIHISDDATYTLHLNHIGDIFDVNSSEDCPSQMQSILADEPIETSPPKKVPICHATGSENNPYVFIFVKNNDHLGGHHTHEQDLFDVHQPEDCPTSLEDGSSPDSQD